MSHNFFQLHKDNKEALIIGANVQREKLALTLNPWHKMPLAKNLGMLPDPDFNFECHISNITKIAFYHFRKIASSATVSPPGRY